MKGSLIWSLILLRQLATLNRNSLIGDYECEALILYIFFSNKILPWKHSGFQYNWEIDIFCLLEGY